MQADESDVEASDEIENTENNDTSENNEAVTIESSITDDKPSIVTQDTTLEESGVDSVVQGSDELVVNNSNKEEIKTESS